VDLGILRSGRLQYVELLRTSGLAIYDEYALDAVKRAAPYPEVPAEMMAAMKPESTGVPIRAHFNYIAEASGSARLPGGAPAAGLENRLPAAPQQAR
jgi:TonB family protein